jgi:hypothetical protein
MSGRDLEKQVAALASKLGLESREQVRLGKRLWGAERRIDVLVTHATSGKRLGVECKSQHGPGSAQEKIPATIQDIITWPIKGIVVFSGKGFTPDMRSFLVASGHAIEFEDLEDWLRFFFGLPLD